MALYFISDLHLDASRPDISRAFLRYLASLPGDAEALYILGDLFEVWIGDDDDNTELEPYYQALKQLNDRGIPCYITHGNRDFLIGQQFCERTGCALNPEPTVVNYQGQAYLILHGDSLCTEDTEYMKFRAMVRSTEWQEQLLAQPLEARRELAANLRDTSMKANASKAEDIMDVTAAEVDALMREQGINQIIHGHTHRPAHHETDLDGQAAHRWVLGDWDKKGWHIRLDENGPELSSFEL